MHNERLVAMVAVFAISAVLAVAGPYLQHRRGAFRVTSGAPYTDNFNAYSNASYLGDAANWVNQNADSIQVNSGKIAPTVAANRHVRHVGTLNEAQYAELDIDISTHTTSGIGLIARASDSADTCYYAILYNDVIYLGVRSAGTDGSQTNTPSLSLSTSATTILRLEASGTGSSTRLTVKTSTSGGGWVTQLNAWDPGTYLSNGFAGVMGYGSATNYSGNEFRSGNL